MERLTERHGPGTVLRALRHFITRAQAYPRAADGVARISTCRDDLQAKQATWRRSVEARVAATAELTHLDGIAGELVMSISRRALVMTDGQRDEPLFALLFPRAPHLLIEGIASPEETRFVRGLIARIQEDERFAPLRPVAEQLAKAQDDVDAAVARRNDRYIAEAKAAGERQVALDAARRAYNLAFAEMQLLFPGELSLVESCFCSLKKRSKATSAADAPDGTLPVAT